MWHNILLILLKGRGEPILFPKYCSFSFNYIGGDNKSGKYCENISKFVLGLIEFVLGELACCTY